MNNLYQSKVDILDYNVTPQYTVITRNDTNTIYDNNNSGYSTIVYFTIKDASKYNRICLGTWKNAGPIAINDLSSPAVRIGMTPVIDVSLCTGEVSFNLNSHGGNPLLNRQLVIADVLMYV